MEEDATLGHVVTRGKISIWSTDPGDPQVYAGYAGLLAGARLLRGCQAAAISLTYSLEVSIQADCRFGWAASGVLLVYSPIS